MIDTTGLINSVKQFSKKNRWSAGEVARDSTGLLIPFLQKVQGSGGPLVLPPQSLLASMLEAEFQDNKDHAEAVRAFSEVFCGWFGNAKSLVGDQLLSIHPNQEALLTGLQNLQTTDDPDSFAQSFGHLWSSFIRASQDGAGAPLK